MSVISSLGGGVPFQTNAPPPNEAQEPPPEETKPPTAQAEPPAEDTGSNQTKPVEASPETDQSSPAAAERSTAEPGDASRSDAAALSIFDRPAVPLPVEEFLPAPREDTVLSEAELRAQAQAVADQQKTEALIEGIASTASQPPKGETLNLLVPLPDGTERPAQAAETERA
ncbi:hypothetical protein C8N43_0924 [Litoreibacter ponti]|uniref:Uncharacterized protein n=1 Tax=Litoreibacter ponti TaxID=1510457 RepID=A0A2T6BJN0_9RHOB|nr:hypothetical protein [Litoreibacter ponti]PTX56269.1 hypothetical protein C8N43_0924 [Litoreibacter ponti]